MGFSTIGSMSWAVPLNFAELTNWGPKGYGLQGLVRLILRAEGYTNIVEGGVGPDGQRDLIACESDATAANGIRRWLISCKDNSVSGKSVNEQDLGNINNRLIQHQCNGFRIVCTTQMTEDAMQVLTAHEGVIVNGQIIRSSKWDQHDLRELLGKPKYRWILALYFPSAAAHLNSFDILDVQAILQTIERVRNRNTKLAFELGMELVLTIDSDFIATQIASYLLDGYDFSEEDLYRLLVAFPSRDLKLLLETTEWRFGEILRDEDFVSDLVTGLNQYWIVSEVILDGLKLVHRLGDYETLIFKTDAKVWASGVECIGYFSGEITRDGVNIQSGDLHVVVDEDDV